MRSKDEMFKDDAVWELAIAKMELKRCDKIVLQFLSCGKCREELKQKVLSGKYSIQPPCVVSIPKDDGGTRKLYCYQGADRVVLAVVYEIYYELFNERVHSKVMSYRRGYNTGSVVRQLSKELGQYYTGYKCDVSKYFDSVSREKVNTLLESLLDKPGGAIDDLVYRLYNDDRVIENGEVVRCYKSLAQGCALSALLSNLMLYDFDVTMDSASRCYYRYSDDFVVTGDDNTLAIARRKLAEYGLQLKSEKVQTISNQQWFNFLGFSVKQSSISFSKKFVKEFRHRVKIETTTINRNEKRECSEKEVKRAIRRIKKWLYDGRYPKMAKYFDVVTEQSDVRLLDEFVKDSIRAMLTNRCCTGGIGWDEDNKHGVIDRGKGSNVRSNLELTQGTTGLEQLGYVSMVHMYKLYKISPVVFKAEAQRIAR